MVKGRNIFSVRLPILNIGILNFICIPRFAECMIPPFERVQNAEAEEELCEPLEEISKCEAANPKCKNEFVGLAYGIAQVSQNKTKIHVFFEQKI